MKVLRQTQVYNLVEENINVIEYEHCASTSEDIVKRAESWLEGNASYSVLENNCEHFATWCVVGGSKRLQVEKLKENINAMLSSSPLDVLFCNIIRKLLKQTPDEMADALTQSIDVTGIVLDKVTALLLLYNIVMTCIHMKDYMNGLTCKSSLKKKLFVIWANFGQYAEQSLLRFLVVYFVLPVLGSNATIPFIIPALVLSASLKWGLRKLYRYLKSLKSPLDASKRTKVVSLTELEIGDIISSRYYGIEHDMIVTEIDKETDFVGWIRCVHYGLPSLFSTREVLEEYFPINLKRKSVQRYDCQHMLCYSPVVVVHRAKKRVGEKKWAIASNRSDHVCSWAKEKRPTYDADDDSEKQSKSNVKEVEIHLMDEIQRGDVIHFKKIDGIVTKITTTDNGKGRSFEIDQIIYDEFWICRKQTITVCLNKDKLTVKKFRNTRCCQMETRVLRAEKFLDKKGEWWFDKGFFEYCISSEENAVQ